MCLVGLFPLRDCDWQSSVVDGIRCCYSRIGKRSPTRLCAFAAKVADHAYCAPFLKPLNGIDSEQRSKGSLIFQGTCSRAINMS